MIHNNNNPNNINISNMNIDNNHMVQHNNYDVDNIKKNIINNEYS